MVSFEELLMLSQIWPMKMALSKLASGLYGFKILLLLVWINKSNLSQKRLCTQAAKM
jgi:hypothetical protein